MFELDKSRFLKRTLWLGIIQLVVLLILVGRLYVFQITYGHHYRLLAEENRVATRPILPPRGQLYDRNGVSFAQNTPSFRLLLLTTKKDKVDETLHTLSKFIPLSHTEIADILKQIKSKRGLDSVIIKDDLTWDQISVLELHSSDLPGISIEVGSLRSYPLIEQGAHILGYVSSPSESEQVEDSTLCVPGLKVGKTGFEKYFDARLRGRPGHRAFEVNARRKVVRELHQTPPLAGTPITTTLDINLQTYVQSVVDQYPSASAVVMDIHNGDILALASSPSFDPNLFPAGIRHKPWNALRDNPYMPLVNKAISGLYPPGSTIKPFLILAALKKGIINKDTTIYCPGYTCLGNHKFHCMHIHGHMKLEQALTRSCDVFFYELGKRVGIDSMAEVFQDLGLGSGGIQDFPARKKGLVPTKSWKMASKHTSWSISDTILTSIGQGYMLATPLELAVSIARLTSGKRVIPRFEKAGDPVFPDMPYDPEHLEMIRKALFTTVNEAGGTAFGGRIPYQGMEMAGKTGTSQVRRITAAQRAAGQTKTHALDWQCREHGLFIGYAPAHDPRYAVVVVIEHSSGSSVAVRAARDILIKTQLLNKPHITEIPCTQPPLNQ